MVCSLASAGFYALHTLRLSEYGDVHATLQATGQVAVNAALDFLTLPTAALLDGIVALRHVGGGARIISIRIRFGG